MMDAIFLSGLGNRNCYVIKSALKHSLRLNVLKAFAMHLASESKRKNVLILRRI